jgi:hypothetical protein
MPVLAAYKIHFSGSPVSTSAHFAHGQRRVNDGLLDH